MGGGGGQAHAWREMPMQSASIVCLVVALMSQSSSCCINSYLVKHLPDAA